MIGFEDFVRCFACDGGLKRWDPDDDPWTEHCRWFPACPFAREQKGEHYIALVQAAVAFEREVNTTETMLKLNTLHRRLDLNNHIKT